MEGTQSTALVIKTNEPSFGDKALSTTYDGFKTAAAGLAAWQTSAIIESHVPTYFLNREIAERGWFVGGLFTGPAASKAVSPYLPIASRIAGIGAGIAISLIFDGVRFGVNALAKHIEEKQQASELAKKAPAA
jgi:hypothetical protein